MDRWTDGLLRCTACAVLTPPTVQESKSPTVQESIRLDSPRHSGQMDRWTVPPATLCATFSFQESKSPSVCSLLGTADRWTDGLLPNTLPAQYGLSNSPSVCSLLGRVDRWTLAPDTLCAAFSFQESICLFSLRNTRQMDRWTLPPLPPPFLPPIASPSSLSERDHTRSLYPWTQDHECAHKPDVAPPRFTP
jgi:hypothetical protein